MSELDVSIMTVKKLLIRGADRLDPITVFLEDFDNGNGKITVSCFGKSWTAHWPAMGKNTTVSEFFINSNPQYIIGYFSPSLRKGRYSPEKTELLAKKRIIELRREGEIDYSVARDFYEDSEGIKMEETIEGLYRDFDEMMEVLFGPDWWHCVGEEPNPEYQYLERIVKAVQGALRIIEKESVK